MREEYLKGALFSSLLFANALLPLTHLFSETGMGYQLEKNGVKVNHLFLMDNLKVYQKNDKEIDS